MTLEYAGARNPLYLVRKDEVIIYKADRQSIENSEGPEPFTNHEIILQKGDRIYLFSDGYVDQFGGPDNRKFMQKRLQELLIEIKDFDMKEQRNHVSERFAGWKGDQEQTDDVSLIGIEIQ
jgi:serine phosphatase RsbU (regulator of sigma subunit)